MGSTAVASRPSRPEGASAVADPEAGALLARVHAYAMPAPPPSAAGVRMTQRGALRMAPDRRWIRLGAEQTIDAVGLGFRWAARARFAGVLPVRAVDAVEGGRGLFTIRVAGIRVVHETGPVADRAEFIPFLSEIPWCPSLYDHPGLAWSRAGERALRVSATVGGAPADFTFQVDGEGRVLAGETMRPYGSGSKAVPRRWTVSLSDYVEMGGMRIPKRGAATWWLPEGPFEYVRLEVLDHGAFGTGGA